jgi:hypothetical protein
VLTWGDLFHFLSNCRRYQFSDHTYCYAIARSGHVMATTELNPASSDSPFDGQALTSTQIRLLTITYVEGTIELQTHRFELTEDLEYDAISYVWGSAPASVTVSCNGRHLIITPTALEMLYHLHRHQANTGSQKIWIDAICINQTDQEEKSTQIPLMRDIYSRAATVIVWMGLSTSESDSFFTEFQDVRKKFKVWMVLYAADPDCRGPVREERPCNEAFGKGLSQLLNSEWFTRLWTFQEVILPPKATLLCGESWADFDEFVDFIVDGLYRSAYIKGLSDVDKEARTSNAITTCSSMNSYRSMTAKEGKTKVLESGIVAYELHNLRSQHVKEPVDRVWAIVGLLESDFRDRVAPDVDYSEKGRFEYWKTWLMFAKALIDEPWGMSLLNIPPTVEPRSLYLPSWCPNLSGRAACQISIHGLWNNAIDNQPASIRWALFEESSEARSEERVRRICNPDELSVDTVKHDDWLRIRGFVLDNIEEVVEHEEILDTSYEQYNEDSEEHMALHDIAVSKHMESLDLARCVYYGKSEEVKDIPDDFVMALFLDCRITDRAKNVYRGILPKLATWDSGSCGDTSWEQWQCYGRLKWMRGHTFFSTKGGRIGFAHPGCQPGDQVAAFYGGEPLYILRQLNPTNDDIDSTGQASDHVQYMGAAFIPHLMEQRQRDAARIGPDTTFMIH